MSEVITIKTSKGDVYIEASPLTIPLPQSKERAMGDVGFTQSNPVQIMNIANDVFDKNLDSLTEIASKIAQKAKSLTPDKVEVEFGFKLSGTGDLIIAKCTTEGNFSIKLTWEKKGDH